MRCTHCAGSALRWSLDTYRPTEIVDGRLTIHDVAVRAFLCCLECGATVGFMTSIEIEASLNRSPVSA